MEIVISGTKGGWKYFTDKKPSGLFDIGAGAGIRALTQQAYAINYKDKNCIFTKYRIIKDVRGDKRVGFVAFSLFLPFDKKLPGKTIKNVLDKVENEYCQKYIPDGRNLEDVRENFSFLDSISSEYDKDIRSNPSAVSDDMQSGLTDAAFVYYPYVYKDIQTQKETKLELEDIFDAPFQEEYTPYRQILFISNDLKDKDENPLVALHHSDNDFTGRIDLKNEYYYLNNYNHSKGVKISAYYNNKWNDRSDKKGENQIRAKWQVEIRYSKDDRCYEPIIAQGTISDPTSDIHKYLEINGQNINIKYYAFNNPMPKVKSVTFEIIDRNGKNIDGAEITYRTDYQQEQKTTDYIIRFTGEDIIKKWIVSAKKSDVFASDDILVIPELQDTIEIRMHDIKKVEITATYENEIVYNFTVCIAAYNFNKQTTLLVFQDETIEKECYIEVSKNEGKDYYFGGTKFCPKFYSKIHIKLNKREREKHIAYILDMGEHGLASAGYSNREDGSDIKVKVKTKGYIFKGFQLDTNKKIDNYAGTLVARYDKQKSIFDRITPKAWGFIGVGILVIGIGIGALCYFLNKKITYETPLNKFQIQTYVEGDSLFIDKLNSYKANWENQRSEIKKEGGGMFGGGEEETNSTKYKEWDETLKSIERAITKRNMLSNKNFAELKNQDYSFTQQKFKDAINKIDSINSAEIGQKLGDVSSLTLTQIADSINSILTLKATEQLKEEKKVEQPKKEEIKQPAKSVELKQNTSTATQTSTQSKEETQTSPAQTEKTSEIIEYIKGSELDKQKLNGYKNTKGISKTLQNSIQLCLDFWDLDGSGSGKKSKAYWNFQSKLNADTNLQNSKLKSFVDRMCQEGTTPSYKEQDKKKGLKK